MMRDEDGRQRDLISDELPTDALVDGELAALIPFARAVWEALPLPSRTVGTPDMDARAFLKTAESQLFGTCYWLKAEAERPKGGRSPSETRSEGARSTGRPEPGERDPRAGMIRGAFHWREFRSMLDRVGITLPAGSPPPGIGLNAVRARRGELELAVPGMREAILDAISLLPTDEQRSALRAVLRIR